MKIKNSFMEQQRIEYQEIEIEEGETLRISVSNRANPVKVEEIRVISFPGVLNIHYEQGRKIGI